MSWKGAARFARVRATEARRTASGRGIDDLRMRRLREVLRKADNSALAAWIEERRAQDLEAFAAELDQHDDPETTPVLGSRRR